MNIFGRIWMFGGLLLFLAYLSGCSTEAHLHQKQHSGDDLSPIDSSEIVYSIYLIGDAGKSKRKPLEPVLAVLKDQLELAGANSSVIFLGDNLYPNGLPAKSSFLYKRRSKRLDSQLKTVENYAGKVYFIPGNHDWRSSGRKGWDALIRQEKYIENHLTRGNSFIPDSGKPGPVLIELKKRTEHHSPAFGINLIALDSQWWLHKHKKPFAGSKKQESARKDTIASRLERMLTQSDSTFNLIVGHHPVYSRGRHGGYFPLRTHLLPPVFGSFFVLYRNIWGLSQDIQHYRYQEYKNKIVEVFQDHNGLIYASGHDHNLQYLTKSHHSDSLNHYIVSGSGTYTRYVNEGGDAEFARRARGFAAIHFLKNNTRVLEFRDQHGNLLYQSRLDETD